MKALGILRGFPGLGRVVSGTAILETLRDVYSWDIEFISYLQGAAFLSNRGYENMPAVDSMDYCSIGIIPTHNMGVYIHQRIKEFNPDIVVVDGEPLVIQSIKVSHPKLKVVALLNPSDIDNPQNDKEAMDFFRSMYSMADLMVVHGLRHVNDKCDKVISADTILRAEIFEINNKPTKNIYCILGGGTVNVGEKFSSSTIEIAKLCIYCADLMPEYTFHIVCSSDNIYDSISINLPDNVKLHREIMDSRIYYSDASLVITRSGRNTLSELAFLGIPTISIVSGCTYRVAEQLQNINSLKAANIVQAHSGMSVEDFSVLCYNQIKIGNRATNFMAGNETVIKRILEL